MIFGEIIKPINLIFDGKITRLAEDDTIKFYESSSGKRWIEFIRCDDNNNNVALCEKIYNWIPITNSEQIMVIISITTGLGFKLFKKEPNCHVYILQKG